MATGYTSKIEDGATFKQFIMGCARAFGALIDMRDDPHDAEIPKEFKVSGYHSNALKTVETELAAIKQITPAQAEVRAKQKFDNETLANNNRIGQKQDLKRKYEAMLTKAKAWQPPSSDHEGLKTFMIEQIKSSIKFDCDTKYDLDRPPVALLTPTEWLAKETKRIESDVDYHKKHHQEEVDRVAGRNLWVKQLRDSLPTIKEKT